MTSRRYDPARTRFHDAVASTIREMRTAAGISERAFAEQIGVSRGMLASIERNDTACSLYIASRIAEALDTTIDAIAPVQLDEKEAAE
jgi:putative transcriptional regulator